MNQESVCLYPFNNHWDFTVMFTLGLIFESTVFFICKEHLNINGTYLHVLQYNFLYVCVKVYILNQITPALYPNLVENFYNHFYMIQNMFVPIIYLSKIHKTNYSCLWWKSEQHPDSEIFIILSRDSNHSQPSSYDIRVHLVLG